MAHKRVWLLSILLLAGVGSDPKMPTPEIHSDEPLPVITSLRPWVGLCAAEVPQRTIAQASKEIETTPSLALFFIGWPWEKAYYRRVDVTTRAYVSYQRGSHPIAWTRKPIDLKIGETLLCVDENRCIRQHCCNAVAWLPQQPVLPPDDEPPIAWMAPPDVPPSVDELPPDSPHQHTGPPLIGDRPPEYWRWVFVPPGGHLVPPVTPVPEPGAWLMVGSGLILLSALHTKRKHRRTL